MNLHYRVPSVLRFTTNRFLTWQVPERKNQIYLTFDDGPTPGVTEPVLDILNQFGEKATFFCTGKNAQKHPQLIKLITDEGHALGNHTFDHVNGWKTEHLTYIQNIEKADNYLFSKLFRPPYGKINPFAIHQLKKKYKIVMWSLLSYDFKENLDVNKAVYSLGEQTKRGDIIVFHD